MTATAEASQKQLQPLPTGCLPPRIRALYVAGPSRTADWLAEAFAADSATEVQLESRSGMADGMAMLRDEVFDAVLVSHEPPVVDALELVDAIRAGSGEEQPVIVLGTGSEAEMSALCFEVGAEAYVRVSTCTTRGLLWTVARAIEHRRLIGENRRLRRAEQHRRDLEQEEARRLLGQQWKLIDSAVDTAAGTGEARSHGFDELPPQLVDHYRELLRTYVIMGSGNLADELHELVRLHLAAGVTARDAMRLHVRVLEEMIQGLGNRSARHVMNRADVLVLEMMIHLSDGYRLQLRERLYPPRQRLLPGF